MAGELKDYKIITGETWVCAALLIVIAAAYVMYGPSREPFRVNRPEHITAAELDNNQRWPYPLITNNQLECP